MKTLILHKIAIITILVTLVFVSCKKDDDATVPNENEVLTARAGIDQSGEVAQTFMLDGSASTSSLNKPFKYKWKFSSKPAGSLVHFNNDTIAKPTFIPDIVGDYELELTISNASGQNSDKVTVSTSASQPLEINKNIEVETILVDRIPGTNGPDYIVTKDVAVKAKLTVNPGVVIAFNRDTRLDINSEGSLIAKGTVDNKIKFTGAEQTLGFWKGIMVYSNNSGNIMENVELLYAGSLPTLSVYKAGLTLFGISNAYMSIKSCLFSFSGGYGIHAAAGSVLGDFTTNTFSNNTEAGIYLDAANIPKLDKQSAFTGNNGRNVVEVMQSVLDNATSAEEKWVKFNDGTPYRLISDLFVKTGWKLEPGVIIESASQVTIEIHTTGYLNAIGTANDTIVFTGVTKIPGYWKGIRSYSTSPLNQISYGKITFGGSSAIVSGKKANLAITGSLSKMTLQNTTVMNSGGYGIFVSYNSALNDNVETLNTFKNNILGDIYKE